MFLCRNGSICICCRLHRRASSLTDFGVNIGAATKTTHEMHGSKNVNPSVVLKILQFGVLL